MTSFYSDYGLSVRTMDAYERYGINPRHTEDRRNFYLTYLEDVVPYEVTVHRVPNHLQPYDLGGGSRREEIQLWYAGNIFMTCVVSLDVNPGPPEEVAGTLAYTHWRLGHCVPDHHQAWGMLTSLTDIRFCSSRDGMEWVRTARFHPINRVEDVVAYFRHEYERVRRH